MFTRNQTVKYLVIVVLLVWSVAVNATLVSIQLDGRGDYYPEDNLEFMEIDFSVKFTYDSTTPATSTATCGGESEGSKYFESAIEKIEIFSNYFERIFFLDDGQSCVELHSSEEYGNVMWVTGNGSSVASNLDNLDILFREFDPLTNISINKLPEPNEFRLAWSEITTIGIVWSDLDRKQSPNFWGTSFDKNSLRVFEVPEPMTVTLLFIGFLGISFYRNWP